MQINTESCGMWNSPKGHKFVKLVALEDDIMDNLCFLYLPGLENPRKKKVKIVIVLLLLQ